MRECHRHELPRSPPVSKPTRAAIGHLVVLLGVFADVLPEIAGCHSARDRGLDHQNVPDPGVAQGAVSPRTSPRPKWLTPTTETCGTTEQRASLISETACDGSQHDRQDVITSSEPQSG